MDLQQQRASYSLLSLLPLILLLLNKRISLDCEKALLHILKETSIKRIKEEIEEILWILKVKNKEVELY